MNEIVLCFRFLYVDMNIGRNLLPLGSMLLEAGLYLYHLPPELNNKLAIHIFENVQSEIMVIEEFKQRKPVLFRQYLKFFWEIFQSKLKKQLGKITFQKLVIAMEKIDVLFFIKNELCSLPEMALFILRNRHECQCSAIIEMFPKNYSVTIAVLKSRGSLIGLVSEEFRDDENIVMTALKSHPLALRYASNRIRCKESIVSLVLSRYGTQNSIVLESAGDKIVDNFDFMLNALKLNPLHYQFISARLRRDKTFTLAALRQGFIVNEYDRDFMFRDDKEVVKAMVQNEGQQLGFVKLEFTDDEDIVKAALKKTGIALKYVSKRLRSNKSIVMIAVQNDGCALQYASKKLKDDETIVKLALQQNITAYCYASLRLQNMEDVYLS